MIALTKQQEYNKKDAERTCSPNENNIQKKLTKTKIKSRCTAYSNHRAKHKETNQLSTQKEKHKAKQSKARVYM